MVNGSTIKLFENGIHPRIHFGPDEISALREKAKNGYAALAAAEILRRAPLTEELTTLAFAHLLTGEKCWLDKAARVMHALTADVAPPEPPHHVGQVTDSGPAAPGLRYLARSDDEGRSRPRRQAPAGCRDPTVPRALPECSDDTHLHAWF